MEENTLTQEDLRKEAEARLQLLTEKGLYPSVIKEFRSDKTVFYSEQTALGGILYWLRNNPDWEKMVAALEERWNCCVYHCVHSYTEFGELLTCFVVTNDSEEWPIDRDDLNDAVSFCYVFNLDDDQCSEWGSIGFRQVSGGLIRTA